MTILSADGKPIEKPKDKIQEDKILQVLTYQRNMLMAAIQNTDIVVEEYIKQTYPEKAKEIEESIKKANLYEQGKKKSKIK